MSAVGPVGEFPSPAWRRCGSSGEARVPFRDRTAVAEAGIRAGFADPYKKSLSEAPDRPRPV
jgi:hypothetical protein